MIYAAGLLLLLIAVLGAGLDLSTRRIPNWLCVLTFLLGLGIAVAGGWGEVLSHLGHAGLGLLIGMALFALRWIGGGDAKFYAGLSAWFPLARAPELGAAIGVSGILLLVVMFLLRRGTKLSRNQSKSVPYGVAIGLGAVVTFFNT